MTITPPDKLPKDSRIEAMISRFGFTRIFSWMGLGGILVISVISYYLSVSNSAEALIEYESSASIDIGRFIKNSIADLLPAGSTRAGATSRLNENNPRGILSGTGIVHLNIYNPEKHRIYSISAAESFQNLTGQNTENPAPTGGRIIPYQNRKLFYTSFPVSVEPDKTVYTFELYRDITGHYDAFRFAAFRQTAILLFFLLLLFFNLLYFVVKTDKIIHRNNQLKHDEQEEKIRYLANFDTLTDLPNRNFFLKTLNEKMEKTIQESGTLALLLIGIDRFKMLNDSLGADTGDWLLIQIARRLKDTVAGGQFISRTGGDEFTVILENQDLDDLATTVLDIQIGVFEAPFTIMDKELILTAGIGVAFFPGILENSPELIQAAENALIRAKQLGRNHFVVYSEAINEFTKEKFEMEMLLKQALHQKEFQLYYQPKISTVNRQVVGMEALIRWNHPEKGIIGPEYFISLLEDSGLILPVGEWIINEAISQCKKWHDDGFSNLKIALNLSFKQIHSGYLPAIVQSAIAANGLDPKFIEFELTESVLAEDAEIAAAALVELKKTGVTISIDDFGTGYSSLSYLMNFPIDQIKIDKSFVQDISENAEKATLTRSIINMAQNLKLKIVAEGIEKEDQMEFITRKGCEEVQGFLFSKAVHPDNFIGTINQINSLKI